MIGIEDIKKKIKNYVKKETRTKSISKFIDNVYNISLKKSELTSVIVPIHYLFDGYINENIGNTHENLLAVLKFFDLDDLFNLNFANYTSTFVPEHASVLLLYQFTSNNRNYIYYSNSGLGIHNHVRNIT